MWVNLYQKKIILSVQTMMLGYFTLEESIFTPYLLFCQFFLCCFLFSYFMQCFVHTFPTNGVSTVSSKRLWLGSVPNRTTLKQFHFIGQFRRIGLRREQTGLWGGGGVGGWGLRTTQAQTNLRIRAV